MSRYPTMQPAPAQPTYEGDESFTALNMKDDRAALAPGQFAAAMNKRLVTSEGHRRIAAKRAGTIMPGFANPPATYTAMRGSEVVIVRDLETMLIADGSNVVFALRDGLLPQAIAIPAGEVLDTLCEFIQANDKVLLARGSRRRTLIWDGGAMTHFEFAEKSDLANTAVARIPDIATGEAFSDSLVFPLPTVPNAFGVSDDLDYTTWDPILSKITIPTGGGIVRLFPWNNGVLLTFMRRAVRLVKNFLELSIGLDDLLGRWNLSIEKVTDAVGLAARKAVIDAGGDVHFLSEPGGIYVINQVFQDKVESPASAVSAPIEPLIRRINWRKASKALVHALGDYIYWAVPLDNSAVNNAVLVYNKSTGAWEGYDTWAGPISIDELHTMNFMGKRQVYAVDRVANAVYVLYIGKEDFLASGRYEIGDLFETRGYSTLGWNATPLRDAKQAKIAIATWNPSINITMMGEGYNAEKLLTPTPITKNNRRFYTLKADYNPTNENNDFAAENRHDYSITLPDAGMMLWDGVELERKQEALIEFSLRARHRVFSYRIESTQGDCDIKGILFETSGVGRVARRAA